MRGNGSQRRDRPIKGWTFAYLYGIIHSNSKRPPRSNYQCQVGEFAYLYFLRIHLQRRLHQAYRPGGDRDAYVFSLRDITAGAGCELQRQLTLTPEAHWGNIALVFFLLQIAKFIS